MSVDVDSYSSEDKVEMADKPMKEGEKFQLTGERMGRLIVERAKHMLTSTE